MSSGCDKKGPDSPIEFPHLEHTFDYNAWLPLVKENIETRNDEIDPGSVECIDGQHPHETGGGSVTWASLKQRQP